MATVTSPPPVALPGPLYRLSLDLYHRMAALGLLTPADRVVLLDGLLVKKMTKGPRLATSAQKSVKTLEAILPAGWHVRKEDPVTLRDGPTGASSEPEPDVAVVRGALGNYTACHPGPAETELIIEVADSSLAVDRLALRRYAWASIPCVWIVNLVDEVVEVYSRPSGPCDDPGYADRTVFGPGDSIAVTIDGTTCGRVAVTDLLP
ncbi:MAG: Uma2 family endonuclease [Isosphaeraceae bacterium]|nr:Uma2 family endonuclease [Isosphaeraceae bacterium]